MKFHVKANRFDTVIDKTVNLIDATIQRYIPDTIGIISSDSGKTASRYPSSQSQLDRCKKIQSAFAGWMPPEQTFVEYPIFQYDEI